MPIKNKNQKHSTLTVKKIQLLTVPWILQSAYQNEEDFFIHVQSCDSKRAYEKYYIILESMLKDLNYQGQGCNFITKIYRRYEYIHIQTPISFSFCYN